MIISVPEVRQFIESEESDQVLEVKLQALESLIRSYTNNNFQNRKFRTTAIAYSDSNTIEMDGAIPVKVGDTFQITSSDLQNDLLVNVIAVSDSTISVDSDLYDENGITITKVVYPADVKVGCANMLKWQLENGEKVGVQSETISRHSVTYFNMDGSNSSMGFPVSLLGFLQPYKKARFGRGIDL